jgi:diketogulonate reductase-like aldo/keto reductase
VLQHPTVVDVAAQAHVTPAQVIFGFARAIGMLPLTGTSDAEHLKQDLATRDLTFSAEVVRAIESLVSASSGGSRS